MLRNKDNKINEKIVSLNNVTHDNNIENLLKHYKNNAGIPDTKFKTIEDKIRSTNYTDAGELIDKTLSVDTQKENRDKKPLSVDIQLAANIGLIKQELDNAVQTHTSQ